MSFILNCLCELFIKLTVPLAVCKRFVLYFGINIWRHINTDLKCLRSDYSFKRSLFNIISAKYLLHN